MPQHAVPHDFVCRSVSAVTHDLKIKLLYTRAKTIISVAGHCRPTRYANPKLKNCASTTVAAGVFWCYLVVLPQKYLVPDFYPDRVCHAAELNFTATIYLPAAMTPPLPPDHMMVRGIKKYSPL